MTDSSGINRDGTHSIQFTIFDASTGGSSLWTNTFNALSVRNGNFQVILGNVEGQPPLTEVFDGDSRFLEIQVLSGPGISAPEPPLVPRQQLVSVPFALRAGNSDGAKTLTPPTSGGNIDVAGVINALGFLQNGAPVGKVYAAFYATGGHGTFQVNLNTGQVSGGEIVFLNGEKFPAGTKAIGIAVMNGYNVGFCQQGNGEFSRVNGARVATIGDVAVNVTVQDSAFGCAGIGGGAAIFIGQ